MNKTTWIAPLALAVACLSLSARAADNAPSAKVTFHKDVLPVLQTNCQVCHRPGGKNLGGMVAPMAFTTYAEVRPWSKAIAKAVSNKTMPPWHAADQHRGVFIGERYLNDDDIETLVAWARRGAPAGNPADAPEPIVFPSSDGWSIGEPDLILAMPEPFFVNDDVTDLNINFQAKIPLDLLPEDRWIKAVEFRPDSPVVHHMITRPFGGIAPGNGANVYRDGYAAKVRAGARVTWNMHYHKEAGPGTGMWDQSSLGVKFYPKGYEPKHVISSEALGNFSFLIPPGDANYRATADYTFKRDAMITNFMPHMHLRGKEAKYVATYPDGTEEVLLHVPSYDYNWQTAYRFIDPKRVPAGTKIRFTGWWDNSADNPWNPDPTKSVRFGGRTDDEMLFGFMGFTDPDEDE